MNPKLSIIIVSYNVSDLLRSCLQSIYNDALKDIEVIVVDNNSTDDSVSMRILRM
jgi:glycosyltransferase involved in cell wall biosynthesis